MSHHFSDDKIVQCPYNKNHIMPSTSLQRHIVKCEKNYGTDYRVICPYNATHRLSKSEIEEHIKTCPTRNVIEASQIGRKINLDSSRWKNESNSFTSITEDSWEEQMRLTKNVTRFAHVDPNDESELDDIESFPSSAGFGRGKLLDKYDYIVGSRNILKKSYKP